jgi:hypothetical protein
MQVTQLQPYVSSSWCSCQSHSIASGTTVGKDHLSTCGRHPRCCMIWMPSIWIWWATSGQALALEVNCLSHLSAIKRGLLWPHAMGRSGRGGHARSACTCRHHKLAGITNLQASQTCRHVEGQPHTCRHVEGQPHTFYRRASRHVGQETAITHRSTHASRACRWTDDRHLMAATACATFTQARASSTAPAAE